MNRRDFLKVVSGSALGLGLSAGCSPVLKSSGVKSSDKPNIIFILADDLGYGDLSCYGQKKFRTPNIDRLAKEGMKFTQFYSGSTVCAPSRCSLMTGLHTGHCYIRGNHEIEPEGQLPIPKKTVTIAKVLKKAGYRTACYGKWGLGYPGSEGAPEKQGFDHFYGYNCQRHAHHHYPEYLWENNIKVEIPENKDGKRGAYSHDLFTEKGLKFVKDNKDGPFFLFMAYSLPHADIDVPEDALRPFKDKWDEEPFPDGEYYIKQDRPAAAFAGMVSRLDRDMGKFISVLKEQGIDKDTLVIFTSDNGPHEEGGHRPNFFDSNGPLRGIKRDLYEGGIRVPFIARWPGKVAAGSGSDHIGAFWDMMPTFAQLAGAKVPRNIDGISIAPTLLGDDHPQAQHKYLYWEFHAWRGDSIQAVRAGKYKAVRHVSDGKLELFDLETDPYEENNITENMPSVAKKMASFINKAHVPSKQFPLKKK
jgi:arylsulfatase A-like enzyme